MADFKLDPWEYEPFWLKVITPYLKKKKFPYLEGIPEEKKWYRIAAPGCVVANGDPFYGDFYKGTENKLMIFFVGGGVSWNEYMAARPASLYQKDHTEGFYLMQMDLVTDIQMKNGIFEESERNPFRNWSKLVVPYSTGDLHCGTGEFPYTAKDGSRRICYHHGYTNFHTVLAKTIEMVPDPEVLLVCGCSGGGFGTSILMDSIMERFSKCMNVTCLVDSGFFPKDGWHDIARDVWKAPDEIVKRVHSDMITLDVLEALHQKWGSRVKILMDCSARDCDLARFMNFSRNNQLTVSKEIGQQFKEWLKKIMTRAKTNIPEAGIYIFDIPDKKKKGMDLTIHCILTEKELYEQSADRVTCMQWICDAVNGKVGTYGLELLE